MPVKPLNLSGLSRRSFLRLTATASVASAVPVLTEAHLAHAQRRKFNFDAPPHDAVRIDANENPLGPCSGACATISSLIPEGGRYDYDLTETFVKTFCDLEGLKTDYVLPYAGSSEPLHYTVLAFTSKDKSYVTADPGYEAGMHAASVNGAKVVKVPLNATHAHDAKAMAAADPGAGVIYVCNPNNPTGTSTPKSEIEYLVANKPKGSVVLIDEAYIHFSDTSPSLDLVKAGNDVIVLRTFSKVYGMAGVRCGLAIGRPDLLEKIQLFGMNSMPIMAVAAATASLQDKDIVPQRKKLNADIRNETFEWLTANNFSFIPSETNCFMLQTNRPGREVMAAMAKQGVYIGRVWPIMPTYVRITVGTRSDMQKFQAAFKMVMNSSTAGLEMPELPAQIRETPFTHFS